MLFMAMLKNGEGGHGDSQRVTLYFAFDKYRGNIGCAYDWNGLDTIRRKQLHFNLSAFAISVILLKIVNSQLFPAIITFGDSIVDIGNNNYLPTVIKADVPPYGRNFAGHRATGRFCDGKLATDFIADRLFFTAYAPAYLSPGAVGNNLLTGANFASAGSGYDDRTAFISGAISLPQQVAYFKDYKEKLAQVAGSANASSIINNALYICSFGTTDFALYYINPLINQAYTPSQYSNFLTRHIFSKYVKDLYSLGARRIGVTSLPPMGCLPLMKTLFGGDYKNGCVERINNDTRAFNIKLNKVANDLKQQLPDIRIVVFDIYTTLYNTIKSPTRRGFVEVNKGCCGTGRIETTMIFCNSLTFGTCSNETKYVFFDSVHPTQSMNNILAQELIAQGLSLLS